MYTTPHARAHAMRIPNICICAYVVCVCLNVCMCVYVCAMLLHLFIIFLSCNCAVCYILDEATYISIDAIDLHTSHFAWLPLLRPDSHLRVIFITHTYTHIHCRCTTHDRLPDSHSLTDRSIIGRIMMNDSNLIKIITRLQRLQARWLELCDASSIR